MLAAGPAAVWFCAVGRSDGGWRGQIRAASSTYRTAAPGAPVSGLALPVRIPPRPSPSSHTASPQAIVAASAAFTAGRQSSPRPMASWMVAKTALNSAAACSRRWPAPVTESAIAAGLPLLAGSMMSVTNPRLNM